MSFTNIIFMGIVIFMIVISGCVSDNHQDSSDIYNCTVNGVAYNVTSGICHGFSSITPEVTPITTFEIDPSAFATPVPSPRYVTCSEYHKIIDKWKTPTSSYITLDDNITVELTPRRTVKSYWSDVPPYTYGDIYDEIYIGQYASECKSEYKSDGNVIICSSSLIDGRSVKLNPISESESGYRDACEVVQ